MGIKNAIGQYAAAFQQMAAIRAAEAMVPREAVVHEQECFSVPASSDFIDGMVDWVPKEMFVADSTPSLMNEFIDSAREKWAAGVKEYRNGDETKAFDGDPLKEILDECVDIYAYSKEAFAQGKINETETDQLNCFAYDAYKLVRHIQKSRGGKTVKPVVEPAKTKDGKVKI